MPVWVVSDRGVYFGVHTAVGFEHDGVRLLSPPRHLSVVAGLERHVVTYCFLLAHELACAPHAYRFSASAVGQCSQLE